MKRAVPWSDGDDDTSSDTEFSTLDMDSEDNEGSKKKNTTKNNASSKLKTTKVVESAKRKSKKGVDLEALSRHGYKGGLSVLNVPPPSEPEDQKQDWSWSKGQETRVKETQESYADRQKTRAAILEGEQLAYARTQREKKELSFSQKEKRKRDLGQASRGKNYVEEEKRLLRDSGCYSGFDS